MTVAQTKTNMATTPVKVSKIDCFVCLAANAKTFKLTGKKLTAENFENKLIKLLGSSIADDLLKKTDDEPEVCRNCHNKIVKCFDFSEQLKASALSFLSGASVCIKRGMLSSLTPKSLNVSSADTMRGSSRKQLKLLPDTMETNTTPSSFDREDTRESQILCEPHSNSTILLEIPTLTAVVTTDHPYDTAYNTNIIRNSSAENKAQEEETLSILERMFGNENENSNLSQSMMLQTLRSQSFSLTSKTAPFASVLCYKGPQQIVECEGIIHNIIHEMEKRLPFLLQVFLAIAVPNSKKINSSIIPVLATCYSILMKHRSQNLTAFHKMTSAIAAEGDLDDRV